MNRRVRLTTHFLRVLLLTWGIANCYLTVFALGQDTKLPANPTTSTLSSQEQVQPIRLKVLVLNYDPFYQGKRLHQVLNFNDPRELAKGFLDDVKRSTRGLVAFEIV